MKKSESITVITTKPEPIKLNAVIYDTETKTEQTKNGKELKLKFGYFKKIINDVECRKSEDNRVFFTKDDFTNYIIDTNGFPNSGKNKVIWAHNTSFDFRIGINTKIFKNRGYSISCFSVNPFILEYVKNDESIMFLDTFNFFKTSIEKLGEFFGIEKIKINFEKEENIDDALLLERCKRDVEVCYRVLMNLYPQMGNKIKYSAAQMAFFSVRENLPYDIQKINTEIADLSFHGGRVEVFRNDEEYTNKYDINSAYPYNMKINKYPIGIEGYYLNPSKRFVQRQLDKGLGFIADCNFDIPTNLHIAPIPYFREDKKLIFPVGKFRTIVCSPEINLDYVTNFNRVEFYFMGNIFEKFIDKYYPLKQNSEGFMREFYKVGKLNSSYGKFAQKRIKTMRFKQYDNLMEFGKTHLTDLDQNTYNMKFLEGECFTNIIGDRKYSVAVGSFVTSYTRADLFNRVQEYGKDLYYVDTDCFVLPEYWSLKTNNDLGGIKIEDTGISRFYAPKIYYYIKRDNPRLVFNGLELELTDSFYNPKGSNSPKTYYFDKVNVKSLKLKGVKKNWSLDWRNNEIFAEGKRFTNFNETLNKNMIGILEVIQNKTISLTDDKRIWNGYYSKPIEL